MHLDLPVATIPFIGLRLSQIERLIFTTVRAAVPESAANLNGVSLVRHHGNVTGRYIPGIRCYVPPQEGSGYWDVLRIDKDTYFSISDASYDAPMRIELPKEPMFKIRLLLSGNLQDSMGRPLLQSSAGCIQSVSGKSKTTYIIQPAKTPLRMIVLHGRVTALLRSFDIELGTIGQPFSWIVNREPLQEFFKVVPFGLSLQQLARDIFDSRLRFTGDIRYQYLKAKAAELLCMALQETRTKPAVNAGNNRIRNRDMIRLIEARNILAGNFTHPPTVVELAREVGLNTTKLKLGFRELFGESVRTFLSSCRMRFAAHLMETSDLSLSEIGYRCGYSHPTNFTQAFRRYYGDTPSELRKRQS